MPTHERVAEFESIGITAFTTTRAFGDLSLAEGADLTANTGRWQALQASLAPAGLVSALQVHGVNIAEQAAPVQGWVRLEGVDAHVVRVPAVAAAVTVADCVPIFIAHSSGTVAIVHAGWRGTAAKVVDRVLGRLADIGLKGDMLHVHLGPSICGRCYEVGPDVYEKLTGWETKRHRHVDLRALLADQVKSSGVRNLSASSYCTRCDNDRFFSHRAGDAGRQVSLILGRGDS